MGYPELRQALRDETGRQLAEIEADASRRAAALVEAARAEIAAERERALAEAGRAADDDDRRALARRWLDEERVVLIEARRLLAELQADFAAALTALVDDELRARLRAELLDATDGEGWEFSDGGLVAARGGITFDNTPAARLARAWPELEPALVRLLFTSEAPEGAGR